MKIFKLFIVLNSIVVTCSLFSAPEFSKQPVVECRAGHHYDCDPRHFCIQGKCREMIFTDICPGIDKFKEQTLNKMVVMCTAKCEALGQSFATVTLSSNACKDGYACVCKKLKIPLE